MLMLGKGFIGAQNYKLKHKNIEYKDRRIWLSFH